MARNPELEEAICEAPADAIEPFLVYGDWLEAQGDPRGELVAVQAKRLGDPNDIALRDAEARILDRHRASLIGDLPVGDGATLLWRLGFIREARIAVNDDFSAVELFLLLREHPSAPFLRKLTVGAAVFGDENHYGDFWDAVREHGLWPTLREHAQKLDRLKLRCGSFDIGRITARRLTSFSIETGGLVKANLKSIVEADWPQLRSLEVYFGDSSYGADCAVEDVQPLLDGKAPPGLTDLGLVNCEFGDALAEAVARSAILPRLQTLSLAMGTMGEEGARAILSNKKAFAHLKQLDLSENFIPDELAGELASVCAEVITDQRDSDGDFRYVVVGE
jgi:uncharacterized protein (TIGR02996 family)